MRDQRVQMNACRSRTSAKAPMGTWQPPPSLFSKARSQVVVARAAASSRNAKQRARRRVAAANFDSQCALPGGRSHHFRRE